MHLKWISSTILLLSFCTILVGQRTKQTNKYAMSIEVNLGQSFPNFDREQDRWTAGLYSSGGMTISFNNKLNKNWMFDLGLGFTAYFLKNKGPADHYIFDFFLLI